MSNGRRRVVVTGLGTINPLGNDVASAWQSLMAGRSGITRITAFDPAPYDCQIAGEVKGFVPGDFMENKEARRMDRYTQLAVVAAGQAVRDSGLQITPENADDVGVVLGAGIGGVGWMVEQLNVLNTRGPSRISPFAIPVALPDAASGQLAITYQAKGPNMAVVTACATGTTAIGEAAEIIRRGDAVAMIAGSSEAAVVPFAIAGFSAMRAVSRRNDDPEHACRPFDAMRDGFVIGEGAGVVILEDLQHALARGAHIYAEQVSYAGSADAIHMAAPAQEGEGIARAIRKALRNGGLKPADVDYINAHGTGTILNDLNETAAIKDVFGAHAYKLAVSSTKSMMGHCMGAAGSIEAIVTILSLNTGWLAPTINYQTPDPQCDLDYVPNVARQATPEVAMSTSMGLGGHNAAIIFSKWMG
jgi:3-oxoacyl-[acyl-carrier-protein] synthase II